MKLKMFLTLLTLTLTTNYAAFCSQVAQPLVKTYPPKRILQNNKLLYIIIKDVTDKITHYRAVDCSTHKPLEYPFTITQTDDRLCINPTPENKFLADLYEGTSSPTPATTQSTSSQASSATTTTSETTKQEAKSMHLQ